MRCRLKASLGANLQSEKSVRTWHRRDRSVNLRTLKNRTRGNKRFLQGLKPISRALLRGGLSPHLQKKKPEPEKSRSPPPSAAATQSKSKQDAASTWEHGSRVRMTSRVRRRETRPMASRELRLEPDRVRGLAWAIGERATCDWRTVRGRCGWFCASDRCRRR